MKNISNNSDFAVSAIFGKALKVLSTHYLAIAILSVCMFAIAGLSSSLASYFQDASDGLSVLLALFFILLYATVGLSLFKVILTILNHEKKPSRMDYLPTYKELVRYLVAVILFLLMAIGLTAAILVGAFPLVYTGIQVSTVLNIAMSICFPVFLVFFLRVTFYPFFILDQDAKAWQSIKKSYHITKDYIFKIILVVLLFVFIHVCQAYVTIRWGLYAATVLGVLNAFFITPFYIVSLAVTYKRMMRIAEKKDLLMETK